MRRILVINSNSNPAVTKILETNIPSYLGFQDVEIVFVNPNQGPQGIDTQLDVAISSVETARLVALHRDGFDAYIIACGSDPGLDVCRSIVSAPVVGISEAGMLMACTLGYKFSIIVNSEWDIPITEERVRQYGFRDRFASARAINMTTFELKDRRKMVKRVAEVGRAAIDEDQAEVIVLPGSVQIGMEFEVADLVGAPVLSGMACAIKVVEGLIALGQKTSQVRKYRQRKKLDFLTGYDDFQNVYSFGD
jgi:allantoin racemase